MSSLKIYFWPRLTAVASWILKSLMFPGEHHILEISELTYKNLDEKSVFDYLNKKQTIDDSIAIFVAKYRDLLYQMPF